ncbi:MAG: hypothetical protein ABL993_10560 [Vicinamibacterales bacterium]
MTAVGGTLGLTGTFGLSDPTIARKRCEADLAVLNEYLRRYEDMTRACLEQLEWGPERYAQLPSPPIQIELKPVPPLWGPALLGLVGAVVWVVVAIPGGAVVLAIVEAIWGEHSTPVEVGSALVLVVAFGGALVAALAAPFEYWRAIAANGSLPQDNARRRSEYEAAAARSIQDATPRKSAEDHRLRVQIRELESLARTVAKKEAAVRQLIDSV